VDDYADADTAHSLKAVPPEDEDGGIPTGSGQIPPPLHKKEPGCPIRSDRKKRENPALQGHEFDK